jgi:molecular chaperone DnaK (HSP70)
MNPVGIDLGTTFSAIAACDATGRPKIILNPDGKPITPSVVCFRDGAAIVGEAAKELQAIGYPTAAFFKRQMGDAHWIFNADGVEHSATDLSALVLKQLKCDAEQALGSKITDAVITVPAYFRNAEREATIAAGRQADLNVLQVINEPTAGAIAYGYRATGNGQLLLVYDLGGGTFDVTLLRIDADEIRVLTSDGDHELGGKDWDDRILGFLGRSFFDEYGIDPLAERDSLGDLLIQAEGAKKRLSVAQSTRVPIVHGGHRGSYTLDRCAFEALTADLMERTISLTRKVLDDQKVSPEQVDGVLLVGGSTRMPMVRDLITRTLNRPLLTGVNVDEAVALGAALAAAERGKAALPSGARGSIVALGSRRRTVDVTNHSLGMIAVDKSGTAYVNTIILPKNQEIPCVQSRPYQSHSSGRGPGMLEVFITQGESQAPADVRYLGRHVIHDVPAAPSGITIVDIQYRYDASGTVQVAAKVQESGKALRVSVDQLPQDIPERFCRPVTASVTQHVSAYLVFDLSGSMCGAPIEEAQKAARRFLQQTDLTHCSLGIIGVSDRVETKLPASQNSRDIQKAIDSLVVGETGYGNSAHPFDELLRLFGDGNGPCYGIVMADGVWCNQSLAVERARHCKECGIDIIAVGFGGADQNFLKAIASSDEASYFTSLNGLVDTFSTIAQVLTVTAGGLAPAAVGTGKSPPFGLSRRNGGRS